MQSEREVSARTEWSMWMLTELWTLEMTSSYGLWRPVTSPWGDSPWEFAGISQAFLISRISGEETHRVCDIYWGQKVKRPNPTLCENNNKTHPTRSLQGHPFFIATSSLPPPLCTQG